MNTNWVAQRPAVLCPVHLAVITSTNFNLFTPMWLDCCCSTTTKANWNVAVLMTAATSDNNINKIFLAYRFKRSPNNKLPCINSHSCQPPKSCWPQAAADVVKVFIEKLSLQRQTYRFSWLILITSSSHIATTSLNCNRTMSDVTGTNVARRDESRPTHAC